MRVRSPIFIGRREELRLLTSWLDEAVAGRPVVALIGGEAGVGKSRLLEEFSRVAAERGVRWLLGAAADFGEGGLPLGAVVEALHPLAQQHASAGLAHAGTLEVLLPDLGRTAKPAAAQLGVAEERLAQQHVFEQLLALLGERATRQAMVLVLEDIHWADASTREFLAFLSRTLAGARVLVLATFRSDDVSRGHPLHRYLMELQRGRAEMLPLDPFGREEVREQASAIRGEPLSDALAEALFRRSEGNAFFSEELLAAGSLESMSADLPANLRDIMLARVEKLSPNTRRLMAAAAVAGTANEALLVAATQLDQGDVLVGLREAVDRSILEPVAGGYAFRHALLREAVYSDLLAAERSGLHRTIASALLAASAERTADMGTLAQVAHHWELGEQWREAFVAAWRAAGAARRAHAQPEAARWFERVVALWAHVADGTQLLRQELDKVGETETEADLATVGIRAAETTDAFDQFEALRLWQAAANDISPESDPDRYALVQEVMERRARELGAPELAERALANLARVIDLCSGDVRARLRVGGSNGALIRGDYPLALDLARTALRDEALAGSGDLRTFALLCAGRAAGYMGRVGEASAYFDQARADAAAAGDLFAVADVTKWQGDVLQCGSRFAEAIPLLRSAAADMAAIGESAMSLHARVIVAQSLHRLGRWREAEAELKDAMAGIRWAWVVAAYLLAGQGRFEAAERELARSADFVAISGSPGTFGPFYAARAELALWQGRPTAALEAVDEGVLLGGPNLRWLGDLSMLGARAAADLRDIERTRALSTRLRRELKRQAGQTVFEPEGRAAAASVAAELSRAAGASRVGAWAAAAQAWLHIPEAYPAAYALYRQAEALLPANRAGATEPLRQAIDICTELGAGPLGEAAEALARRARLSISPARTAGPADDYGLTAREREVLDLIARGHSDREIAAALYISPKTASVHVSNIKAKLGVDHRIQAASVGLRLGLGG